jgi:hypothetical protein
VVVVAGQVPGRWRLILAVLAAAAAVCHKLALLERLGKVLQADLAQEICLQIPLLAAEAGQVLLGQMGHQTKAVTVVQVRRQLLMVQSTLAVAAGLLLIMLEQEAQVEVALVPHTILQTA